MDNSDNERSSPPGPVRDSGGNGGVDMDRRCDPLYIRRVHRCAGGQILQTRPQSETRQQSVLVCRPTIL